MSPTVAIAKNIGHAVLDLVFPVRCVLCGEFGEAYLCERCAYRIPEDIPTPICEICGHHSALSQCNRCKDDPPPFTRCVCAGSYSGNLRDAIFWLKYRDRSMLAEPLGRVLTACASANKPALNQLKFDAIIPVPMRASRQRVRGYNHAERLALEFGKRVGIRVKADALRRVRATRPQVGLSADIRKQNLIGSMRASSDVRDTVLLVIDDVSTTGSSLREAARALKEAGASEVYCLTLAAG